MLSGKSVISPTKFRTANLGLCVNTVTKPDANAWTVNRLDFASIVKRTRLCFSWVMQFHFCQMAVPFSSKAEVLGDARLACRASLGQNDVSVARSAASFLSGDR